MIVQDLVRKINADLSTDEESTGRGRSMLHQGPMGLQIRIDSSRNCPIVIGPSPKLQRRGRQLGWRLSLALLFLILSLYAAFALGGHVGPGPRQSQERLNASAP